MKQPPPELCPACGPGHCTPCCPERAWRYPDPEDQYPPAGDLSRSRAHGADAPGVDSADPLHGTGVKHPRPWRLMPGNDRVLLDRNGNQVGRLASAELAQIVVACVNAQPECSQCGAPVPPYVVPRERAGPTPALIGLPMGALPPQGAFALPHLADALGQTKERE